MRYFAGENAGRPLRAGKRNFPFSIVGFYGGTHQGVMAVDDADAELVLRAAGGRIQEITEAEYTDRLKKKAPIPRSIFSPARVPSIPSMALKGDGAVVVSDQGAKFKDATPAALPGGIDDIVIIGTGAPPTADVAKPIKTSVRAGAHQRARGTNQ